MWLAASLIQTSTVVYQEHTLIYITHTPALPTTATQVCRVSHRCGVPQIVKNIYSLVKMLPPTLN